MGTTSGVSGNGQRLRRSEYGHVLQRFPTVRPPPWSSILQDGAIPRLFLCALGVLQEHPAQWPVAGDAESRLPERPAHLVEDELSRFHCQKSHNGYD